MGSAQSDNVARIPTIPSDQRFSVRYSGHAFGNDRVCYDFLVLPPVHFNVPGQIVRRTYDDVQKLATTMALRYPGRLPMLPSSNLFFESTDLAFIGDRAKAIQAFLETLLDIEPIPRTNALRRFLCVVVPPTLPRTGSESSDDCIEPASPGQRFLLGETLVSVLVFCEPLTVLRYCCSVSKAFRWASLHPRCWPTLSFSCARFERSIDSISSLLLSVGANLKALSLHVAFEDPLGVALPAQLVFQKLKSLNLLVRDLEAAAFVTDLLGCVESPSLQQVSIAGSPLTLEMIRALKEALTAAGQNMKSLNLLWVPDRRFGSGSIHFDVAMVSSLQEVLARVPDLKEVCLGIDNSSRGVRRSLAPLNALLPVKESLLCVCIQLKVLRKLHFDFVTDEMLQKFVKIPNRSLNLVSLKLAGMKRDLNDPDGALATLLEKQGNCLEELSFQIDAESELRPFLSGTLHPPIGALPNLWEEREAMRRLELNWTAFDDEGIRCIVQNCPNLETLLLDRCEYWTDTSVQRIVSGLRSLTRLRIRASQFLTDAAIYSLLEVQGRLTHLELEPSYSMSRNAISELRTKLQRGQPNDWSFFQPFSWPPSGLSDSTDAMFMVGLPGLPHPRSLRSLRLLAGSALPNCQPVVRLLESEDTEDDLFTFSIGNSRQPKKQMPSLYISR